MSGRGLLDALDLLQSLLEHERLGGVREIPRANLPAAAEPPEEPKADLPTGKTPSLEDVRREMGDCRRCKLAAGRTNLVFGVGDAEAEIVFVGEAPGADEDRRGEPFVGRAGQLLTRMIEAMGLSRGEVYICNILKCRPPGNRDPEADEVAACEPFLKSQLRSIRPRVIVTLGRISAHTLLRIKTPISKLRGQWRRYEEIDLMPTYHPAYLLRNPAGKRDVWEDLQAVMRRVHGEGWRPPQGGQ